MGSGRFPVTPVHNADYRQGYLCGMVRGDANLASYDYVRAGRTSGAVHRFRPALVDLEALQRTRAYLDGHNIETREFLFSEAVGARKAMYAIRSQALASVATIQELIRWPELPTPSWSMGWLAGIFDAEGSYSGSLRISNTDDEVLERTTRCLTALGFRWCLEDYGRPNGLRPVRLLGGLKEVMRFFLPVDPAITRKRNIEGVAIKGDAPLRVVSVESLGVDLPLYDMTTGTGDFIANGVVSHNCFARPTHTYLDFNAREDFEREIVVKVNVPERLRAELARPSWQREHVALGTNTDPYQWVEGRYKLMEGIWEALRDAANPCSVLTKSPLLLRDLALMREVAARTSF